MVLERHAAASDVVTTELVRHASADTPAARVGVRLRRQGAERRRAGSAGRKLYASMRSRSTSAPAAGRSTPSARSSSSSRWRALAARRDPLHGALRRGAGGAVVPRPAVRAPHCFTSGRRHNSARRSGGARLEGLPRCRRARRRPAARPWRVASDIAANRPSRPAGARALRSPRARRNAPRRRRPCHGPSRHRPRRAGARRAGGGRRSWRRSSPLEVVAAAEAAASTMTPRSGIRAVGQFANGERDASRRRSTGLPPWQPHRAPASAWLADGPRRCARPSRAGWRRAGLHGARWRPTSHAAHERGRTARLATHHVAS
jgi:hypothetical protein